MKMKSQTITFLVAFVILLITAGMMFLYSRQVDDSDPFAMDPTQDIGIKSQEKEYLELPSDEDEMINSWIEENNLNQYGDPLDTVYIGGTPLFNEETGEYQERYDYLVSNYPEKPWLSSNEEDALEDSEKLDQETEEVEDSEEQGDEEETSEEPMSFSEVEEWQTWRGTNYQMDYPDFAQIESQEYPVAITGDNNFEFTIYRQAEEPENESCEQAVNFGEDAVYLCHNQEELYQSVYQRMKDSLFIQ